MCRGPSGSWHAFCFLPQAKRADVSCVILPDSNRRDFEDLPEFIRKDVEVHFVKTYSEIFDILFPES